MGLPVIQSEYSRVQSPSSINTFRQCPRKYYYHYIEELPSSPSIYTLRGNIAHSVLEEFFALPDDALTSNFAFEIQIVLKDLLTKHWKLRLHELQELGLFTYELEQYFKETVDMVHNWGKGLVVKLQERGGHNAFSALRPVTEKEYRSTALGVRGFIDAIHTENGEIRLLDYKTSRKNSFSQEYKLQLAIYALLYQQEHGVIPTHVGINFLRHGESYIPVDDALLQFAHESVMEVHHQTKSKDMKDYPKKTSGLCKWRTGQCDYFDECQPF